MANEQVNVPSLLVILVLSGLIIRYLFFSSPAGASSHRGGQQRGDSLAALRSREAAVERIQQMFPQVDRRTILWDLQRNGGSVPATTERILAGRMETPPITFQPPPPPGTNGDSTTQQPAQSRASERPTQPDLITRYNLKDKIVATENAGASDAENSTGSVSVSGSGKTKAWSTNKEERQSLLQKRRDQMILEARRRMEAKIAAEKAAAGPS